MDNFNSVNRNVFCAAYVFWISALITSKLKFEYFVFKGLERLQIDMYIKLSIGKKKDLV